LRLPCRFRRRARRLRRASRDDRLHAAYVVATTLNLRRGELFALGIHPRVVLEIVGHSAIEMTMNVYGHVALDLQRDALGLNELLDWGHGVVTTSRLLIRDIRVGSYLAYPSATPNQSWATTARGHDGQQGEALFTCSTDAGES
jgi:hypothetical protein